MTTATAKSPRSKTNSLDLDSWLFAAADLEADAIAVLTAYRAAAESVREAASASLAMLHSPEPEAAEPSETTESPEATPRGLPSVPRLHSVEGIESPRLASLHGQLLAGGFLTAEVLGRADGLAYRVTREGLRRLDAQTGPTVDADAA
jgi:hypothetical protein